MDNPQWLSLLILIVLQLIVVAFSYGGLHEGLKGVKEQVVGQRDDLKEQTVKLNLTCERVTALESKVEAYHNEIRGGVSK